MTNEEIRNLFGLHLMLEVGKFNEKDKDLWSEYVALDIGSVAMADFDKKELFDSKETAKLLPEIIDKLKNLPVKEIPTAYYQMLRTFAKSKKSKNSNTEEYKERVAEVETAPDFSYEVLLDLAKEKIEKATYLTALEKQIQLYKIQERDIRVKPAKTFFDDQGMRLIAFRAILKMRLFGNRR